MNVEKMCLRQFKNIINNNIINIFELYIMDTSDKTFDILGQIQYKIMAMSVEQQLSLLNDCLNSISQIKSEQPKLMTMINNTFNSGNCVLTKESLNLFREFISTYNIGQLGSLIESSQTGGVGDEDSQLVSANQTPQPVSLFNQPSKPPTELQQQVNQPINAVAALAQSACNIGNLTPEAQILFMKALNTAVEGQVATTNANAAIMAANAANENYFRRLNFTGTVFSFLAPGALIYYFQSVMDKVAVGTLYAAGNIAADTVGGVELGIRNAIPFAIDAAKSTGRMVKNYIPESVFSLLKSTSQSIPSQMTDYAKESVTGTKISQVTSATAETTGEMIFMGCILVYIILVLVLSLLTTLIIKFQQKGKIKLWLWGGVTGAEVALGGRLRRNSKTRNHRNKRRRTRKRH